MTCSRVFNFPWCKSTKKKPKKSGLEKKSNQFFCYKITAIFNNSL